jgi:hypothetical protein
MPDSDNLYLSDNNDVDTNTMGADMVDTDTIDAITDANLADTDMMDTDAMDANMTGAMIDTHAMNADLTDADMMDANTMDNTSTHTMEDDLTDAGTMDVDAIASAIIVNQFPFGCPGGPIIGPHQTSTSNRSSSMVTEDSLWSLFCFQLDWEVVHWAKTCGATSSAVADLLAIPGVGTPLLPSVCRGSNPQIKVVGKLGLSYQTTKQLNDIIDKNLPELPPFECQKLKIGHKHLDFHYQDMLQYIQSLYGNPELVQHLVFAPEQHYTDHEQMSYILSEMHTSDWWWSKQVHTVKFNKNPC